MPATPNTPSEDTVKTATRLPSCPCCAGVLILLTNFDSGSLLWLAIIAIVSGVVTLVWHMKEGPPTDSGWDDGAVV